MYQLFDLAEQTVVVPVLGWETAPAVVAAFVAAVVAAATAGGNWLSSHLASKRLSKEVSASHQQLVLDGALRMIETGVADNVVGGLTYLDTYLDRKDPDADVLSLAASILDAYTRKNSTSTFRGDL